MVRIVIDTTGSSEDIARQIMALYFDPDRGVVPKQGEIDAKVLAQAIQLIGRSRRTGAALPHAERFIDLQCLKAAGLE